MYKKIMALFLSFGLLCGIMPVSAFFESDEGKVATYIIELESAPVFAVEERSASSNIFLPFSFTESKMPASEQESREAIFAEQNAVLKEIGKLSGMQFYGEDAVPETLARYFNVFNGFAMELTAEQAEQVSTLSGIKNVVQSREFMMPKLVSSTDMIAVNQLPVTEYDGTGAVIAILDAGFQTDHPFFALTDHESAALCKDEILALQDELGIDAEQSYKNAKIPFAYDYAESDYNVTGNEHGTHVAGIAAGNGADFSGVAPEAQMILMKVFGTTGAQEQHILSALDDLPLFDCVSVANLSLGIDYFLADPGRSGGGLSYTDVFSRLSGAGILVNCAAGNAGRGYKEGPVPAGQADYGAQGLPANYEDTFSVAASVNTKQTLATFKLADGTEIPYMEKDTSFMSRFLDAACEYVYVGYGNASEMPNDLSGKIALIDRGGVNETTNNTLTFAQKETNAHAAGAVGVVYLNNENAYITPAAAGLLPVCIVSQSDAETIKNQEIKTLTTDSGVVQFPLSSAGEMATFSSWGVDYNLNLKPEITAPGQAIYSSMPGSAFGTKSGTSMAAPHISGATALLNEYVSKTFPLVAGKDKILLMQNLMMSTATPIFAAEGVFASPRQQGAGQLNLAAAMESQVVLLGASGKSKISLGDDIDDCFTLTFSAENLKQDAVCYDTVSVSVMAEDYTISEGKNYVNGMKNLTAVASGVDAVNLAGFEKKEVSLAVTLNDEELAQQAGIFTNGFFIDGFVTLRDSEGVQPELHIPFTGFRGNWEVLPKIDKPYWDAENSLYHATGLVSKIYGEEIKMGQNFYENNAEPTPKYAAISPNGDGIMDSLRLDFSTLASSTSFTVDLRCGNLVLNSSTYNYMPKYQDRSLSLNQTALESLAEGNYEFRLSALNSYDGNTTKEVLQLPFVIDKQRPEITKVREYMNGGRKMLAVAACDNQHVMSIVLVTDSGNTYAHFTPETKGEICETVFDITEVLDYQIGVTDYAGNSTSTNAFPVVASHAKTGNASYQFSFAGTLESAQTVYVIPAVYASSGRLISVGTPTQLEIPQTGSTALEHTWTFSSTPPSGSILKIFYWTDMETIKPAFVMPVVETVLD